MRIAQFLIVLFLPSWVGTAAFGNVNAAPAAASECRWAEGEITIDGRADEPAWRAAETIDRFSLPWLQEKSRPARTATRARLLWDREYLYFHAEMEDQDLYAPITEHDGRLWENDVFELFFKPAEDKPGYYEFQVNPAGAVLDMFIPRRGSGEYARYHADGPFHVDIKAIADGTLNRWSDRDRGWQVEGRIPWGDFLRTGGRPESGEVWRFALCRYDYSVEFEGPELSTSAPLSSLTRPDFHRWEDYAPLKFIGPDPKSAAGSYGIRERILLTTSRVTGSPDPPPPFRVERAHPQLKLSYPIYAELIPGTARLLFLDQDRPYAKTRLCRTGEDPTAGEIEVLLELEDTAYSFTFHPHFAENGYLYLGSNGAPKEGAAKETRITRYTFEREKRERFAVDSAMEIISWPSDGHNGGALAFGGDGMLYITSGDGTSDSDTNLTGQGLDHLLAKVLRIDVDRPTREKPYSVPPDNPFVKVEDARPETWAYGFRNPWRMACDPATGDLWVGNNGQDLWEQVYLVARGANYGWSVYEGSHPFYLNRKLGPTPVSRPAAEHHHSEARSLTGGLVYHGEKLPTLRGMYVYGDYSTGKIWAVRHADGKISKPWEIADTELKIPGFAIDAAGDLLVLDHSGPEGGFHRLTPAPEGVAEAEFPRRLSETGLFTEVASHRVQPALIPYSVNSPLWSDGAYKERYMAIPGEAPTIEFHPTRSWGFPEGTVLVKSFAVETIEGDAASREWIETRLFTRQQGEWVGYSYAWNEAQTDATLVETQGAERNYTVHTTAGVERRNWRFPSRAECLVCHSRAANFVLGVTTAQLNKLHDYGEVKANQLSTLEAIGLLRHDPRADFATHYKSLLTATGKNAEEADAELKQVRATRDQRAEAGSSRLLAKPPSAYDQLADPYNAEAPLESRARSYLHVNCASCHVEAGGGNAQIDLAYTRDRDAMRVLGLPPLHQNFGLPRPAIVAAGAPERSVLLHRTALRGPGQMPPLATSVVDQRAVAMLREWIASLEATPSNESSP